MMLGIFSKKQKEKLKSFPDLSIFQQRYTAAKMSVTERTSRVAAVIETLECDLELLCLTGVEDKLQNNVKQTLELLRNAGMKASPFSFALLYYCQYICYLVVRV